MDYQTLKKLDTDYILPTYARFDMGIHHGEGTRVFDFEGREYLDFTSGIGVSSLGYGHPALVAAAKEQADQLFHMSNLFITAPMAILAEKLCKASGLSKVFFANSGAEANEGAIKLARKYSFLKYGAGRHEIVSLVNSFHGRTVTTLKATGQEKFHNYFFPFTEGFVYGIANDLEDVKSKISDKTCAVMVEIVQGEGGVLPLDSEFLLGLADYCKARDILLICDEVQTGIGRTGTFFAFSHLGLTPDIVTAAKGLGGGLPIGAVLAAEGCATAFTKGDHGSTFGGNPMSAAVANAVVDVVTGEGFLEGVQEKSQYLRQKLAALDSPYIQDLRGKGLMLGIALTAERVNTAVAQKAMDLGLLVLTAGQNVVRLLPPLTLSFADIDKAVSILGAAIKGE